MKDRKQEEEEELQPQKVPTQW